MYITHASKKQEMREDRGHLHCNMWLENRGSLKDVVADERRAAKMKELWRTARVRHC
jgi:hypothetical protein